MLRILIFDSGVGGLSISESLSELLPAAEQILLADNACFPYGEMDEELLIKRVTKLLVHSVSQFQPDCIVVACNTVSTLALDKIRSALSLPVIGVVPAIKPAALQSNSKVIGLLATPATVERTYTADLVNSFADDCVLISVGNTRLVEISEERLRGEKVELNEVKVILQPFIEAENLQQLDAVVLGCTHFPLLSDILSDILPKTITLIDSSKAIARQVAKMLKVNIQTADTNLTQLSEKSQVKHRCYMTKLEDAGELENSLSDFGFNCPHLFQ